MGVKKMVRKINGQVKEVEVLTYDRDADTTFNHYTPEEIIQIKTLIRHVGGYKAVCYELFKKENGYTDSSKRLVVLTDKDGNPTDEKIYKPILEVWNENYRLRMTYKQRLTTSLNIFSENRSKTNHILHQIVQIVNAMATKRDKEKKRTLFKGISFIKHVKDAPQHWIPNEDAVKMKQAVESITSEPTPTEEDSYGE